MKLIRSGGRRATALVAGSAASLLALSGVAYADVLENNVVAGGNDHIVIGGSTTISYRIQVQGTGNDGEGGCNATDSSPATVNLTVPADVTASRTSLVFTECGDRGIQTVTFSSSKAGSYPITITKIADAGIGSYINAADFTLSVSSPTPANTKPSVAVIGATAGASYEVGSEPSPGCSVTDNEDGPSTKDAVVTGTLSHGLGGLTATCDYTDQGGLSADTKSITYTIVDTKAPTINGSVSPDANADGWHNTDVAVSFICADTPGSGIQSCVGDTMLTTEGADQSVTGTATDWADNTSTTTVSGINIDKTKPTISPVVADPNASGWYSSNVTVAFDCADLGGSGIKACEGGTTLSAEGANQSVVGAATDLAGNSETATAGGINIDKTAPAVALVGGPTGDYYYGNDPVAPTCDAADSLSGLASCVVTGGGSAVGQHTWTATATDNAGNTATAELHYEVKAWEHGGFYSPVDMGDVWNTVKGGSTVPLKFEIFNGTRELTSVTSVKSFAAKAVSCPGSSASVDAIETVLTGGTALRYDSTGGQFVQNWQTPKKPGTCATATITTQDGGTISANFLFR